jgi:hypothetical protein
MKVGFRSLALKGLRSYDVHGRGEHCNVDARIRYV